MAPGRTFLRKHATHTFLLLTLRSFWVFSSIIMSKDIVMNKVYNIWAISIYTIGEFDVHDLQDIF